MKGETTWSSFSELVIFFMNTRQKSTMIAAIIEFKGKEIVYWFDGVH